MRRKTHESTTERHRSGSPGTVQTFRREPEPASCLCTEEEHFRSPEGGGFFAEQRQKIFEKYGKANADGTFCFEGEGEQKASAELEELLELEVEPSCQRLDIPISEELRLSVNDLGALAPFVQFTEE